MPHEIPMRGLEVTVDALAPCDEDGFEVFLKCRICHHGAQMRHASVQEDARGEVIGKRIVEKN